MENNKGCYWSPRANSQFSKKRVINLLGIPENGCPSIRKGPSGKDFQKWALGKEKGGGGWRKLLRPAHTIKDISQQSTLRPTNFISGGGGRETLKDKRRGKLGKGKGGGMGKTHPSEIILRGIAFSLSSTAIEGAWGVCGGRGVKLRKQTLEKRKHLRS